MNENHFLQRAELLLTKGGLQKIAQQRVIIFGMGGVGSWCAESLVRTGITKLTIVDFDTINETNVNRQLHATSKTIGLPKVEVMKKRLLEINPDAEITAIQEVYSIDAHDRFEIEKYDYIVDAIDSINSKIHLIRMATRTDAKLFSSMGAALKIDPLQIKVAEFWKVHGCPLASLIRKRIRKGDLPAKKFMCVYSPEQMQNQAPQERSNDMMNKVVNGSLVHITASFGFIIAGLIVKDILEKE
jgi:tRNA A37 threonylcarbamoyladenosine dehydratase